MSSRPHGATPPIDGEEEGTASSFVQQAMSSAPKPAPQEADPRAAASETLPTQAIQPWQKRRGSLALVLLVSSTLLLTPLLFLELPSQQRGMQLSPVGQARFTSSGQLNLSDLTQDTGSNDILTLTLQQVSRPANGKSYYAWLLADQERQTPPPVPLGRLTINGGNATVTYREPQHRNLFAAYSCLLITEEGNASQPRTPSHDLAQQRLVGCMSTAPIPNDGQHLSLLDHVRHVLASDPVLQTLGLTGGLQHWTLLKMSDVLHGAIAAREHWSHQQVDAVSRSVLQVVQILDGAAYAWRDLPANAPLVIDPKSGRLGLLPVDPVQQLPAYLSHIETHLQAIAHAPGHTEEQQQLAILLDKALQLVMRHLQKARQDAIALAQMNSLASHANKVVPLLNDLVNEANAAYAGTTGLATGTPEDHGLVWCAQQMQALAMILILPVRPTR
ncbi:MAG: hypothetical protein J2P37_20275 [Ktedonobacteraceae bacterium]|nr:hypothetical protein [Ktedonobacteraceae bacterium]